MYGVLTFNLAVCGIYFDSIYKTEWKETLAWRLMKTQWELIRHNKYSSSLDKWELLLSLVYLIGCIRLT